MYRFKLYYDGVEHPMSEQIVEFEHPRWTAGTGRITMSVVFEGLAGDEGATPETITVEIISEKGPFRQIYQVEGFEGYTREANGYRVSYSITTSG